MKKGCKTMQLHYVLFVISHSCLSSGMKGAEKKTTLCSFRALAPSCGPICIHKHMHLAFKGQKVQKKLKLQNVGQYGERE